MTNYVDFFRFNDRYEDVFVEDNHFLYHFLYAVAEYGNYNGFLLCNVYRRVGNDYIREDTTYADAAYLEGLEPAFFDNAREIIEAETRRTAYYAIEDDDEREAYIEYATAELERDAREILRDMAVNFSYDVTEHNYSYGEMADFAAFFEEYGAKYDLLDEFRENAIC